MAKQTELPGTERPTIKEIDKAADHYVNVRDKRMKLTEQEVIAKANLLQVVLENEKDLSKNDQGEIVYRYDDEIVIVKPGKANVKVKGAHDEESEDDDE